MSKTLSICGQRALLHIQKYCLQHNTAAYQVHCQLRRDYGGDKHEPGWELGRQFYSQGQARQCSYIFTATWDAREL